MKFKGQRIFKQGFDALRQGRLAEAEERLADATIGEPNFCEAWFLLGLARAHQGKLHPAIEALSKAANLMPEDDRIRYNLGLALHTSGSHREACLHYEQAVKLNPSHADAWHNMAVAYENLGETSLAIAAYRRLLKLPLPNEFRLQSLIDLGQTFSKSGQIANAEDCYRQALAIYPGHPRAKLYLGLDQLARGQWTNETWDNYQARWLTGDQEKPLWSCPQWQGEKLHGRHLLLWPEQGMGDSIMMFRYIDELSKEAEQITLAVPVPLLNLFAKQQERVAILTMEEAVGQLQNQQRPQPNFHCSLMDLLRYMAITPQTISFCPGYLAHLANFPNKCLDLATQGKGTFHVGLAWAGNPKFPNDGYRSLPHFRILAPLLNLPGIKCHSLYVGQRIDELQGFEVENPAAKFKDFGDTAACIKDMDLVISVDTAIAHLAGALGKPVWILLQSVPDWRWYPYGETTPWYPTARLFIQRQQGDWDEVVSRIGVALRERLTSREHPHA